MLLRLLLLSAVLLALFLTLRPRAMVAVHSSITGKQYMVRRLPDRQLMADRLATLEQRMHRLVEGATALMPDDPRVAAIRSRWDGTLSEVESVEDAAYSVGKTSIHVCLRDRDGRVEDLNTSMFVLVHELAHVATAEYDHTPQFWANMRFLLELAERLGVYRYEDYDDKATTFCGHTLGASPLTCVKRGTCEASVPVR